MRVRVLAFARLREIVGAAALDRSLTAPSTVRALWDELAREFPALAELRGSTRFSRDGKLIGEDDTLADGDEVALLPPFGGG